MNQFQMFLLQLHTSYMYTCISLWTTKSSINTYMYTYLPYSAIHAFPMPSLSLNQVLFQPGGHTLHVPHMEGS